MERPSIEQVQNDRAWFELLSAARVIDRVEGLPPTEIDRLEAIRKLEAILERCKNAN